MKQGGKTKFFVGGDFWLPFVLFNIEIIYVDIYLDNSYLRIFEANVQDIKQSQWAPQF